MCSANVILEKANVPTWQWCPRMPMEIEKPRCLLCFLRGHQCLCLHEGKTVQPACLLGFSLHWSCPLRSNWSHSLRPVKHNHPPPAYSISQGIENAMGATLHVWWWSWWCGCVWVCVQASAHVCVRACVCVVRVRVCLHAFLWAVVFQNERAQLWGLNFHSNSYF